MFPIYFGYGGAASILSVLMSVVFLIFSHLLLGVQLIGCWFTYKKMHLPGWKGIIPLYNVYVLFEELWETRFFWRGVIYFGIFALSFITGEVLFAVGGVSSLAVVPGVPLPTSVIVVMIIGILFFIAALVMLILSFVVFFKIYHKTAKAFGLKTAWAWGMMFVPYIMFPIIGFNRNIIYYGPINTIKE